MDFWYESRLNLLKLTLQIRPIGLSWRELAIVIYILINTSCQSWSEK